MPWREKFMPRQSIAAIIALVTFAPYTSRASPHDMLQARSSVQTAPQRYLSAQSLHSGDEGLVFRKLREGTSSSHETCKQVVAEATKEPIRITFELLNEDGMRAGHASLLKNVLMPKALNFLNSALRVYRATEPLHAMRVNSRAPTCGFDGVRLDDRYLEGGPGAPDTDLHVLVTVTESAACSQGEDLLAYASWCVKDQCDRPIFSNINFCGGKLSLEAEKEKDQVYTTIHELTHAMVFSASLFKYFRNSDGTPMLPRKPGNPDEFPDGVLIRWSCRNGGAYGVFPDNSANPFSEYVDLATHGNILGTFDERGFTSSECKCPIGKPGLYEGCLVSPDQNFRIPTCVTRIKTPAVLEQSRAFFDCSSLGGAELENQDTSPCVIIASHWEQRVFNGELMAAYSTPITPRYISSVTLAMFQDSGWYDADVSKADHLVVGVHWGYMQGCKFAVEKCVEGGATQFPNHWCAAANLDTYTCSLDRKNSMTCPGMSILDFTAGKDQFKYYTDNRVALYSELDYCPVPMAILSNRICASTASQTFPSANANYMREVFGQDSRCLMSTLHADVWVGEAVYDADKLPWDDAPVCYHTECFDSGNSYTVKIASLNCTTAAKEGESIIGLCTSAGQILTRGDLAGSIICAPPQEVCFERRDNMEQPPAFNIVSKSCGRGGSETELDTNGGSRTVLSFSLGQSLVLGLCTMAALVQVVAHGH